MCMFVFRGLGFAHPRVVYMFMFELSLVKYSVPVSVLRHAT